MSDILDNRQLRAIYNDTGMMSLQCTWELFFITLGGTWEDKGGMKWCKVTTIGADTIDGTVFCIGSGVHLQRVPEGGFVSACSTKFPV